MFYHFRDRAGLLMAVIEDGLQPLRALHGDQLPGDTVADSLHQFAAALEQFLDTGLVAIIAAQSDTELRTALGDYMRASDLGPHRGVQAVAGYLARQQAAGVVRSDIDPAAAAFLLIGASFLRVSQQRMGIHDNGRGRPGLQALITTLDTLLAPAVTD